MPDCKQPSTDASEETSPAADRRRSPRRQRDVKGTAGLRPRAARRFPEMLPAIRLDNESSRREVDLLLRSLLILFAGRGRFVTGTSKNISHSKSCHKADAAGKSRGRGRVNSRPNESKENEIEIASVSDSYPVAAGRHGPAGSIHSASATEDDGGAGHTHREAGRHASAGHEG